MKYLLDTDICIFFLQGKYEMNKKVNEAGIENCFISEITIGELKYGAEKSNNLKKHLKEVDKIEGLFTVIPIYENFDNYAKEKVRLQKAGNLIPDFDLLIGVTSTTNKMVLVTNNEKHFNRTNGVKIENWRKPAYNKFIQK